DVYKRQVQNSPVKPYSTVKLRVRERDFFSRWNLFAENGWVVADDTNHWYGKVHTNNYIGFRNRMDTPREVLSGFTWQGNYLSNYNWDRGTRFYSQVTSTMQPRDYAESGGRDDAYFVVAPDWAAQRIDFPPLTALSDMGNKARQGASKVVDDQYGTIWVGPKGVSIIAKSGTTLDTYISFVNKPGLRRRVAILVKRGTSTYWQTTSPHIELTTGFIIHTTGDVKAIGGLNNNEPAELNGRVTIVSEREVLLTDDIYYEDDNDNRSVVYDSANPGGDNFSVNPNYTGNACLGVMAAKSIYLTNNDGFQRNDKDLIVCGVFAAGVGGSASDGSFSWLPWGDSRTGGFSNTTVSGSSSLMRDLRLYGALLSDGNASTGLAHWKGYTSGGSPASGYSSSVFRYDFGLLNSPPPEYMQINMPKYSGWQLIR
ncbi:MAG: hypothetical protein N2234_07000, partial [Planctomycetota bacterium]|nr:hypothetical protein [Planctomycetota bacterium]